MLKTKIVLGFMLIVGLAMSGNLFATNNCLDFDGTDDYVDCGNNSAFNVTNITIESWIYPTDFKTDYVDNSIVAKVGYYKAVHGYVLSFGGSGVLNFTFESENDHPATNSFPTGNDALTLNTWQHVAAVFDDAGNTVKLYVNGLRKKLSYIQHSIFNSPNNLVIGSISSHGNYRFMTGKMDEVRIWNVARTEAEIRDNMYKELAGTETGLVGYYKFNETSGTTADNAEGTAARDGTLTNMDNNDWVTSPAFAGPKNCLDFDGTDDFVNVGNSDTLDVGNTLTLETWLKPTALDGRFGIFSTRLANEPGSFQLEIGTGYDGTNRVVVTGPGTWVAQTENNVINVAEWYHIVYTRSGTGAGTHKIYVNGAEQALITNADFTFIDNNSDKVIGSGTNGGQFFEGQLDEIRLWNVVRTAQQIRENMCKTLVGNESGLVAYYNFDNSNGTTLQNFSGNNNDGTLQNMEDANWVSSSAFNTWLNTNSSSWATAANWSDSTPISTDNVGIINYSDGTAHILSGNPTLNNLVVDDGFTLSTGLTVNGNLILENNLDLNGQTITLGYSANLVESTGNLSGTSGTIQTTRSLSNIDEDVAGLGAKITTTAILGSTTIIRGHEAQGTLGIKRYYQINPTNNTGLNATLVFNYLESELNGVAEADLKLFKSADGNSWTEQSSSVVNTTNNTLTLSSIDGFSWWTGGKTGAGESLPVVLSSFTAQYLNNIPTLYWETQSETDNIGWYIYRNNEEDFENAERITNELIDGYGTTTDPHSYLYKDNDLIPNQGETYWYWLQNIDFGGKINTYEPQKLIIPNIEPEHYEPEIPIEYGLHQNNPNPFNPSLTRATKICFNLHNSANVAINVYNIKGQLVRCIYDDFAEFDDSKSKPKVTYWDGRDKNGTIQENGIYLYRMNVDGKDKEIKRLILLR